MPKLDLGIKKETLNNIIIKKKAKNNKILYFLRGGQLYADFRFSCEVMKPNSREEWLYLPFFGVFMPITIIYCLWKSCSMKMRKKKLSMSFTTSSDRHKFCPGRLFATGRTCFISDFLHLIHAIWHHSSYCVMLETWILRIFKTKFRN